MCMGKIEYKQAEIINHNFFIKSQNKLYLNYQRKRWFWGWRRIMFYVHSNLHNYR